MRPVLIVEDDPSTRQLLAQLFQSDGIAAVTAANGQEGLLRLKQDDPCLVLLDLMMPVASGEDFRRAQLRDPILARVPTVLVTAVYDLDAVLEELAPVAVIKKPFNVEEVLEVVRNYCTPG
jgi:CheY-like chemotaxis protein